MDHEIVIPSESYDFSKIKLSTPIDLKSGGTHFTKILQNGNNNELFIKEKNECNWSKISRWKRIY